jgi:mannose-6-phosphate isomerase-like protein (cupin superfamily)
MTLGGAERVEPLVGREVGGPEGNFVIAEWEDDGRRWGRLEEIAPLHIHHSDDEAWYVLEGTLGFVIGDREVEAPAGSAVLVPRGTPHSWWNARPERARYLLVMTPRVRRLVEELHDSGNRGIMAEVFRRYDSELLA